MGAKQQKPTTPPQQAQHERRRFEELVEQATIVRVSNGYVVRLTFQDTALEFCQMQAHTVPEALTLCLREMEEVVQEQEAGEPEAPPAPHPTKGRSRILSGEEDL